GVAKDVDRAIGLYEQVCNWGYGIGCGRFGQMHAKGAGSLKRDKDKARQYFRLGCDYGDQASCKELEDLDKKPRPKPKDDCAESNDDTKLFDDLCALGDAKACSDLAAILEQGKDGVCKSKKRAAKLYAAACDRGLDEACVEAERLGGSTTTVGARGPARAVERSVILCQDCDANTCSEASTAYSVGRGVKRDE